jgi:hypothetical protein
MVMTTCLLAGSDVTDSMLGLMGVAPTTLVLAFP